MCFVLQWGRNSAVGAVSGSGMAETHVGTAEAGMMAVPVGRLVLHVSMPIVHG